MRSARPTPPRVAQYVLTSEKARKMGRTSWSRLSESEIKIIQRRRARIRWKRAKRERRKSRAVLRRAKRDRRAAARDRPGKQRTYKGSAAL
jgi:hypothetical protein